MKLVGLLIGGEMIIISTISVGLSYKIIFVLFMLHTFMHLSQIAKSLMLSMNSNLKPHLLDLVAECKILASMGKL